MIPVQNIWSELAQEEQALVLIAGIFFGCGVLFIAFLFMSRVVKSSRLKKELHFQSIFQSSLNFIIVQEWTGETPEPSYWLELQKLDPILRRHALARQVMVNQLVNMKKSLSGAPSRMLDKTYRDLHLHRFSIRKLSRRYWKVQAQGIRELTEMNYHDPALFMEVLIKAGNKTLQEEIVTATVRLDKQNPLAFLEQYDGEITSWMRINIHHHLALLDPRSLPDFSRWFPARKEDVVLFAISMARHFRQNGCIPALVPLLNHENPVIVASAIRALSELEAYDTADQVVAVSERYWDDKQISTCIVRYLGTVSHSDTHLEALAKYLDHKSYSVRSDAVRALTRLGDRAKERLHTHNKLRRGRLTQMIEHANEPLLQ